MRPSSSAATADAFNNLPRLPVPPLRKTLDRYLKSLEPFLLEEEKNDGQPFNEAYDLRVKWADEFEQGIGKECQERLLALDRRSPYNWLDDNFWIDKAYLEWRAPLVVNSNWWLAFAHDKSISQVHTSTKVSGITPWQVRRAAWLAHRTLQYKDSVAASAAKNNTRTGIWLRESVARLFNVCRIPRPQRDIIAPLPPTSSIASQSIIVTVHNWFYLVRAYNGDGLVSVRDLESQIRAVVCDAKQRLQKGEKAPCIGALSADDRDRWAENLSYLLSLFPENQQTYEAILHSLMAISLDDTTHVLRRPPVPSLSPLNPACLSFDSTHPKQLELDAHLHTIRSTPSNVSNRFFDKPFTLIVDPSARAGAMGEHSPVDALVPSIVSEYAVIQDVDEDAFSEPISPGWGGEWFDALSSGGKLDTDGWTRLDWIVDVHIQNECNEALKRAKTIIDNSDDSVLWFQEYGTDWMKTVAKLSPDAYIQQALQLAWYRTRGSCTATYETVLTRMFKHGRTETIRTLTTDSRAWVQSMMDPNSSNVRRISLLQRAIRTHSSLTRSAATGGGIDRHLMGLQLMLTPADGERPKLFSDELFQQSTTWKLSTSGLSAGYLFQGTGFGAAYDDGYGINYLAAPSLIKFGIESKFTSPLTSTSSFQAAIVESLQEMRMLFEHQGNIAEQNHIYSHL